MSNRVLEVSNVSKKFCRSLKRSLYYGVADIFVESIYGKRQSHLLRDKEFWVFKDVSFALDEGEAIGLVGRNGSGKTTLLKIISCLIRPDSGSVKVTRRVAPLLAVGAGLSPVLTGRENIGLNLSLLGVARADIRKKTDSVIDFAELGDSIDSSVQTYSSGMISRLGFSCAVHSDPTLLLVDEVLAVGDMKFRQKCYKKINDMRRQGTSLVLVSHNSNAITAHCANALYLKRNSPYAFGPSSEIMNQYESDLLLYSSTSEIASDSLEIGRTKTESPVLIQKVEFFAPDSGSNTVLSGEDLRLRIYCLAQKEISDLTVGVLVKNVTGDGIPLLFFESMADGAIFNLRPGENTIELDLPRLGLRDGVYSAKIRLSSKDQLDIYDSTDRCGFRVLPRTGMSQSLYYQVRNWKSQSL
jgi:lipopolysaccharide transport system ATP-binding protein